MIKYHSVVVVLLVIGSVCGRPKDVENHTAQSSLTNAATTTDDPALYQSTVIQKEDKPHRKGIEELATVYRSSNNDPSLSPSVQKVADQLIDTVSQLVDTRTPPLLQQKVEKEKTEAKNETVEVKVDPVDVDKVEANGRFEIKQTNLSGDTSEGKAAKKDEAVKGVAVPVIMEEEPQAPPKKLQKIPNVAKPPKEEKKKVISTTKPQKETPTTTPSSGLSTWILLSDNRDGTTPSPSKSKKTVTTTTKKPAKEQPTTIRVVSGKPSKKATPKPAELKKTDTTSALEGMVKNQKKSATTSRPVLKNKSDTDKKEDDMKKVVTIPPAILIETTQGSTFDDGSTDSTVETTTKKKKTGNKKRKKNKNKKKKPAEKTGGEQEIKDLVKQPKQPVGAQFYNFLSREIMPTVGLGLVGVLVTAGLAGLLGYNPFNNNLPVRRTYESQHGYSPNNPNYYTYNSEYGDTDGGQNEEVLFREVLSGMPEDSRYKAPVADASYPETQLYSSQELAYASKTPSKTAPTASVASGTGSQTTDKKTSGSASQAAVGSYSSAIYGSPYQSYSDKDSYGSYSSNAGSSSFVYPEPSSTTEKFKASAKYAEDSTFEKQPEALYRVSSDYSADDTASSSDSATDTDSSWHRIGSPSVDYSQYSNVEPGPRRLNIDKMTLALTGVSSKDHRRSKRNTDADEMLARDTSEDDGQSNNEVHSRAEMALYKHYTELTGQQHSRVERSPEGLIARLVRRSKEVADLQNDQENEIESDFDTKASTENTIVDATTIEPTVEASSTESSEEVKLPTEGNNEANLIDSFPNDSSSTSAPPTEETPPSFMDVIRRLAQFKLRLGINFLKTTADALSKYLEGVQRKVDETMVNDTSFPSLRNVFLGRDGNNNDLQPMRIREKRFQRDISQNEEVLFREVLPGGPTPEDGYNAAGDTETLQEEVAHDSQSHRK